MDRYNLGSGVAATEVTSSNLEREAMVPEQTEESRLAGYAAGDTTQLSAEVAPNLLEIGEISTPSETPEIEAPHSQITRQQVTLFVARRAKSELLTLQYRHSPGHCRFYRRVRVLLLLARHQTSTQQLVWNSNMNRAHLRLHIYFTPFQSHYRQFTF